MAILRLTPDLRSEEIRQKLFEQNVHDTRYKEMKRICLKAEKVSVARRNHLVAEKEMMYNDLLKAKEAQDRKDAELKEVQKLAQVVAELKRQELVKIKTNQLFQNNSQEYRCAEKQSQSARVQDELLSQINEKEVMRREEKAREYYDYKQKRDSLQKNFDELQYLEKQLRTARVKEELLSQIKEKEIMQKEKKAREYYNDIKMIEIRNNDNMNRKETENNHKSQNKLKRSFWEEWKVSMKIKNELKEKEREKIKDEEKQLLQNFQNLNQAAEKKISEKRQKMIEYGKELKIMIDQNVDNKKKQRIQILDDEYLLEMDDSFNKCI